MCNQCGMNLKQPKLRYGGQAIGAPRFRERSSCKTQLDEEKKKLQTIWVKVARAADENAAETRRYEHCFCFGLGVLSASKSHHLSGAIVKAG